MARPCHLGPFDDDSAAPVEGPFTHPDQAGMFRWRPGVHHLDTAGSRTLRCGGPTYGCIGPSRALATAPLKRR